MRLKANDWEFIFERWSALAKKRYFWIRNYGVYLLKISVLDEERRLAQGKLHQICGVDNCHKVYLCQIQGPLSP